MNTKLIFSALNNSVLKKLLQCPSLSFVFPKDSLLKWLQTSLTLTILLNTREASQKRQLKSLKLSNAGKEPSKNIMNILIIGSTTQSMQHSSLNQSSTTKLSEKQSNKSFLPGPFQMTQMLLLT